MTGRSSKHCKCHKHKGKECSVFVQCCPASTAPPTAPPTTPPEAPAPTSAVEYGHFYVNAPGELKEIAAMGSYLEGASWSERTSGISFVPSPEPVIEVKNPGIYNLSWSVNAAMAAEPGKRVGSALEFGSAIGIKPPDSQTLGILSDSVHFADFNAANPLGAQLTGFYILRLDFDPNQGSALVNLINPGPQLVVLDKKRKFSVLEKPGAYVSFKIMRLGDIPA